MPLISNTNKGKFWERISLPVVGSITPGAYTNPSMSVDEYGRIISISSNPLTASMVMYDEGFIVSGSPFNSINFVGSGVVASNGGSGVLTVTISGGTPGVSVESNSSPVTGGPHSTLNFVGPFVVTTDSGSGRAQISVNNPTNIQRYRTATIGTSANNNLGASIESTGIVRRIVVAVTTAYSGGATIQVENGTGGVLMAAAYCNPQLIGSYEVELPQQTTGIGVGNEQIKVIIGGSPSLGAAVVTVNYLLP